MGNRVESLEHYWQGQGYGSHCPILYNLLEQYNKGDVVLKVLELGCGDFSTPLLCDAVLNGTVTSLESNKKWYDKMVNKGYHNGSKLHTIEYITNWGVSLIDIGRIAWDIIFVDHDGLRRVQDAIFLKDQCDFMVLHDTDADGVGGRYGWDGLWQHFDYRKDFKGKDPIKEPATSIVSNVIDIEKWWK